MLQEIFIEQDKKRLSIQAPGIGDANTQKEVIELLKKVLAVLQAGKNDNWEVFYNEISIKK